MQIFFDHIVATHLSSVACSDSLKHCHPVHFCAIIKHAKYVCTHYLLSFCVSLPMLFNPELLSPRVSVSLLYVAQLVVILFIIAGCD